MDRAARLRVLRHDIEAALEHAATGAVSLPFVLELLRRVDDELEELLEELEAPSRAG